MSQWMNLIPAYGRDYSSQKAVKADWDLNKDFQDASSGKYVNKSDIEKFVPDANVNIRYAKLLKVVNVK